MQPVDSHDDWFRKETYHRPSGRESLSLARFLGDSDKPSLRASLRSGIIAGLVGAALMALVLMLSYDSRGSSVLLPARLMVHHVTGDIRLAASDAGIAVAFVLHFGVMALLGALFGGIMARIIGRVHLWGGVLLGALYGLLAWMALQYVVIGILAPDTIVVCDQYALVLSYLVYGASLGLFGRAYQSCRYCSH